MTEEPSLTVIPYDGALVSDTQASVERLEFGKFCISPNGPIESSDHIPIEHSQLGWSDKFPQQVIPACYPTKLRIVQEGESLPRDDHGTVLRPLIDADDKIHQIFYRVRSRPEDGEGQSGRRYTVARYLTATDGLVNPLTLLWAMDSVALVGITRVEAATIPSIQMRPEELNLDDMGEAFLREALIYVLSGIAISITEDIEEEDFFTWVAAVSARLPPVLRPHLSAGWNVGSSYSGKLGITYTTYRVATSATFSPTTGAWSRPDYVTTWDAQHQPVVNRFFEGRLEPGRLFERYVSRQAPPESSTQMEERASNLVDSLPPVKLPELPNWDDPLTVRIFRYPGLQARDQFTLSTLGKWLATGEDSARLNLDARQLSYHENRIKALDLILQGLNDPSSRSRADHALWLSITGKVPASFSNLIKGAAGTGARRAQLIAAISSGDVFNTLSALQAAPSEESADLPSEVANRMVEILDQSLVEPSDETVSYHARLLPSALSHYQEWARRRSLELMRVLGSQEELPRESLTALVQIDPSETIRALHYFLTNELLIEHVESAIKRFRPDERRFLIVLFSVRWNRQDDGTALRREALLDWFRLLQPTDSTHPLLRLLSGAELTDEHVIAIADDVEHKYVPESLRRRVAELMLRKWPLLRRRIISRHTLWFLITNFWPRKYARVLGRGAGTDSPDHRIVQTAKQLQLGYADLEHLMDLWCPLETFSEAAPLLWDWAVQLQPRDVLALTALDLCRYFVEGRLPEGDISATQFENFVKLASESGRANLPSEAVQRMWESASKYWQIRLLLTIFPQENLIPSPAQLSLMLSYRGWLEKHFREPHLHSARRNAFTVALEPFQNLSFRESPEWRDAFLRYPIWGAFYGVPVSHLPPDALRIALRTYSGSAFNIRTGAQPDNIIKEQVGMCLKFLGPYKGKASETGAIRKILWDFVLPLLRFKLSKDDIQDAIGLVGSDLKLPGYDGNEKYRNSIGVSVYDLISQLLVLTNSKFINGIIKEFNKARP